MRLPVLTKVLLGDSIGRLGPKTILGHLNKRAKHFQYREMASDENKENQRKVENEEQEVTIEKVVAKDNKGIDYDKLISKYLGSEALPLLLANTWNLYLWHIFYLYCSFFITQKTSCFKNDWTSMP